MSRRIYNWLMWTYLTHVSRRKDRRRVPREKTERRTHKRMHDWDDAMRHDKRIT